MTLNIGVDLIQGLFVLTRVGALIVVAPIFGPVKYPKGIKALFAAYIGMAIWVGVPASTPFQGGMVELTLYTLSELLLGITIGFTVQLIFTVVTISGQMISMSGGLAMASVMDPLSNSRVTIITKFQNLIVFLLFFQMNLHHELIRGIAWSFRAIPPGGVGRGDQIGLLIVEQYAGVIAAGLQIALPSVVVVLLVQAGMALLARMAPQMNIFFAVGHMATLILTLVLLYLSMPLMLGIFRNITGGMSDQLIRVVELFSQ